MKEKIFNVVRLLNGDLATILEVNKNSYKVEIVDEKGKSKGFKTIKEEDIKEVIVSK